MMRNKRIEPCLIIIKFLFLKCFTLLVFFNNQTNAEEFEITPINTHFLGVVATSKNIIAYGNNGVYLMTTDKGNTWIQHSINEFAEIRKIVNYNDTLFGILDKGDMIQSVDHGVNWTKHIFKPDSGEKFINLVVTDNSIYKRDQFHL